MNSINLLPSKYKRISRLNIIIGTVVMLFLLIIGILMYFIYDAGIKKELLTSNLAIIDNEINRLNDLVVLDERLQNIKLETSSLKSSYQNGKLYESNIVKIVESVVPQKMKISSIIINGDGQVELIGCLASSYDMVVELLTNIKDISIIENLQISSIVKEKTKESLQVKDAFPKRGTEYVPIGDITTTDFFKDTYAFSLTFKVKSDSGN